jgi:hypothetical protein
MMRHADIRTTFNIYGDVVTDEMTTASQRVAQITFRGNGAQTERSESKPTEKLATQVGLEPKA